MSLSASRRSHPKSRLGCKTCKSRKVKCDESKPACRNCVKHNVECDFLLSHRPKPSPSISNGYDGLNMADMELLHNYSTSTCNTFSENDTIRGYYRINVVQMAFKNEYIMRTLLAISALQLARYRAQSSDYYVSLATAHHQIATRTAMHLMTNITSDNAPMLFLFSNLTMIFALAAPRQESEFLLVGESGFPDWMFLLRGTKLFHPYLSDASKTTELAPLLQNGKRNWIAQAAATLDVNSPVKQRLDHVASMTKILVTDDDHAVGVYLDAIEKLEHIFAVFATPSQVDDSSNCPDVGMAFIWLFEVTDGLLPLLKVPTQEAAVLLAFFAVILGKSPNRWWLQGWPEHLLSKIYAILDEEHRLWIRWPMEEIGWLPP